MRLRPSGPTRSAALVAGFTALAAVAFGPDVGSGFVADDFDEIWKALSRRVGGFSGSGSNFRPLHLGLLRLDHAIGGLDPLPYKLTNLVLHVANALLVTGVVAALGRKVRGLHVLAAPSVAVLSGALFLVGPSRAEPVSWIAARADVLVTLGCLSCLLAWLHGRRWLAVAALAVAMAAKESAVVFPVVVALVAVADDTRDPDGRHRSVADRARRAATATWPLFALLVPYVVVRAVAIRNATDGYGLGDLVGPPATWPFRVVAVVVRSIVPGIPLAGWLLVAAAGVVVVIAARPTRADWARPAVVLLGAATLTAAPSGGLGVAATAGTGERLSYLPAAFTTALVAAGLVAVARRLPTRAASGALVAVVAISLVGLVLVDDRWVDASEVSQMVVAGEGDWPRDTDVILVNLPNTVRGVYAARNLQTASLALIHGWSDPNAAGYVRSADLAGPDSSVTAQPLGDLTWSFTLGAPDDAWVPAADDAGSMMPGVTVSDVDRRTIEVTFADRATVDRAWFFDGRSMVRLVAAG